MGDERRAHAAFVTFERCAQGARRHVPDFCGAVAPGADQGGASWSELHARGVIMPGDTRKVAPAFARPKAHRAVGA
jgi:hypothetical protein